MAASVRSLLSFLDERAKKESKKTQEAFDVELKWLNQTLSQSKAQLFKPLKITSRHSNEQPVEEESTVDNDGTLAIEDVSSLRFADLRKELKKRGLKIGGHKASLVTRLCTFLEMDKETPSTCETEPLDFLPPQEDTVVAEEVAEPGIEEKPEIGEEPETEDAKTKTDEVSQQDELGVEDVSSLLFADLRKELKKRGLKTRGHKASLVTRLCAFLEQTTKVDQAVSEQEKEEQPIPVDEQAATDHELHAASDVEIEHKQAVEPQKAACVKEDVEFEKVAPPAAEEVANEKEEEQEESETEEEEQEESETEEDEAEDELASEDVALMRCADLRNELKKRGLKIGGRKSALVSRLRTFLLEATKTSEPNDQEDKPTLNEHEVEVVASEPELSDHEMEEEQEASEPEVEEEAVSEVELEEQKQSDQEVEKEVASEQEASEPEVEEQEPIEEEVQPAVESPAFEDTEMKETEDEEEGVVEAAIEENTAPDMEDEEEDSETEKEDEAEDELASEDVALMRCADLRNELKKRGLKIGGRKSALVSRLRTFLLEATKSVPKESTSDHENAVSEHEEEEEEEGASEGEMEEDEHEVEPAVNACEVDEPALSDHESDYEEEKQIMSESEPALSQGEVEEPEASDHKVEPSEQEVLVDSPVRDTPLKESEEVAEPIEETAVEVKSEEAEEPEELSRKPKTPEKLQEEEEEPAFTTESAVDKEEGDLADDETEPAKPRWLPMSARLRGGRTKPGEKGAQMTAEELRKRYEKSRQAQQQKLEVIRLLKQDKLSRVRENQHKLSSVQEADIMPKQTKRSRSRRVREDSSRTTDSVAKVTPEVVKVRTKPDKVEERVRTNRVAKPMKAAPAKPIRTAIPRFKKAGAKRPRPTKTTRAPKPWRAAKKAATGTTGLTRAKQQPLRATRPKKVPPKKAENATKPTKPVKKRFRAPTAPTQNKKPRVHPSNVKESAKPKPVRHALAERPVKSRMCVPPPPQMPRTPECYQMTDHDTEDTDWSDRSPDRSKIPRWARPPRLQETLEAQQAINPDTIFPPENVEPCDLEDVFRNFRQRQCFQRRGPSANWTGDRLRWAEQLAYQQEIQS